MPPKRPKIEPIRNPTLFKMGKLEQAPNLANSLNLERPYSEPGLLLGTSAFTANGWPGAFYPPGMKPTTSSPTMRNNSRPLKLTAHIMERRFAAPIRRTLRDLGQQTPGHGKLKAAVCKQSGRETTFYSMAY